MSFTWVGPGDFLARGHSFDFSPDCCLSPIDPQSLNVSILYTGFGFRQFFFFSFSTRQISILLSYPNYSSSPLPPPFAALRRRRRQPANKPPPSSSRVAVTRLLFPVPSLPILLLVAARGMPNQLLVFVGSLTLPCRRLIPKNLIATLPLLTPIDAPCRPVHRRLRPDFGTEPWLIGLTS